MSEPSEMDAPRDKPDIDLRVQRWTYVLIGPNAFGDENIPLYNGKPAKDNKLADILTPSGRRIIVRYDGTVEDTGEPKGEGDD